MNCERVMEAKAALDIYNYQEQVKCKAVLQNQDLWQQFHNLDTEMIITKSGRRMFPSLRLQLSELDPNSHYCVLLEMTPVTTSHSSHSSNTNSAGRHKYTAGQGWAPASTTLPSSSAAATSDDPLHSSYSNASPPPPRRVYLHPESPAPGAHWMYQPVSFGRVKLTNTVSGAVPAGHLVLASMHKYQPRVIVVRTGDVRRLMGGCDGLGLGLGGMQMQVPPPHTVITFAETAFIAVTAYQNDKITKLKIDNNPFAKGFRENGQSKCKRKRTLAEQSSTGNSDSDEPSPKHTTKQSSLSHKPQSMSPSLSTSMSPSRSMSTLMSTSAVSSSELTTLSDTSSSSSTSLRDEDDDVIDVVGDDRASPCGNSYSHRYDSSRYLHPYGLPVLPSSSSLDAFHSYYQRSSSQFNAMLYQQMTSPMYLFATAAAPPAAPAIPQDLSMNHQVIKPRKLTDFSIKAITGLT